MLLSEMLYDHTKKKQKKKQKKKKTGLPSSKKSFISKVSNSQSLHREFQTPNTII